ncbi:TRBP2 protein, partial [Dasyornis broadbenti]|nr:TRBP2 protein [Dasyornis broadbenti]
SLEQMVAASPGKTPISLLQEYGTRLGRTPGYDLLKAEGQAHQPNFTFRVTLGDISCTGGTPDPSGIPCPFGEHPPPSLGPHIPLRTSPAPVLFLLGTIIPLLRLVIPIWGQSFLLWARYPYFGESYIPFGAICPHFGAGYPHLGTLIPSLGKVIAILGRLSPFWGHSSPFWGCLSPFWGSGTSKKLAKRNAAAKMLVRIHNVPMEPRDGSEAEGEEDQFNMTCPRLEGLRGRAPGCTWDSLRNSAGEKLGQLR